jgi:hypothetical protein
MSSGPLDGCCELLFQRRLRSSMHLFAQLSPEFGHCIHLAFGRAVAFFEHAKFDRSQHVEQNLCSALVHSERVRDRRYFFGSGLFRFGHRPSIARVPSIGEAADTKILHCCRRLVSPVPGSTVLRNGRDVNGHWLRSCRHSGCGAAWLAHSLGV